MKSVSLHHTDRKHGLCVVLCFEGGQNWRLYACQIPNGREAGCPDLSEEDSIILNERKIMDAIASAKAKKNNMLWFRVKKYDVELPAKNVEAKISHIHEMDLGHTKRTNRKRRKK